MSTIAVPSRCRRRWRSRASCFNHVDRVRARCHEAAQQTGTLKASGLSPAACPTLKLRELAGAMRRGGVGYYPASDFVHLDTARVRFW